MARRLPPRPSKKGKGSPRPSRPGTRPGAASTAFGSSKRPRPAGRASGPNMGFGKGKGPRPDPDKRPRPGVAKPEQTASHAGSGPAAESKGGPRPPRLDEPQRINKVLARAGIASRRASEELILQGRVAVDGEVVRDLATRIPEGAKVEVDGEALKAERLVYYAISKPKGYVSTNDDPGGRPRVVDLLPEVPERVYSVGRLDEQSTGLMILTNDGLLANRLAHPKFGVEKVYRALVAGLPAREALDQLMQGVWLSDGKARARRVRIVGRQGDSSMLELVLAEGKNREVRRMLAKLGHKVMSLQRVAIGPVSSKGLKPGDHRTLTGREIDLLKRVANGEPVPTAEYGRDDFRSRRDFTPRRGPRPIRLAAPPPPRPSPGSGRPPALRRRPPHAPPLAPRPRRRPSRPLRPRREPPPSSRRQLPRRPRTSTLPGRARRPTVPGPARRRQLPGRTRWRQLPRRTRPATVPGRPRTSTLPRWTRRPELPRRTRPSPLPGRTRRASTTSRAFGPGRSRFARRSRASAFRARWTGSEAPRSRPRRRPRRVSSGRPAAVRPRWTWPEAPRPRRASAGRPATSASPGWPSTR